MKRRMEELRNFFSSHPYNGFVKGGYVALKPVVAKSFYTLSCGDARTASLDAPASGVIFKDGSFLTIYERWSVPDNRLVEYSHHYQVPGIFWLRYDKDPVATSAPHPEHHVQTSALGKGIRLPSGEISCEEVVQMIVEQFVKPKQL